VETAIFRVKTIFGDRVRSCCFEAPGADMLIRCSALKRMTHLDMPNSYRYRQGSLALSMIANIKEGLGMAGLLMFVHGLLVCIGASEYAFART
jgi:hypothetical protein